MADTQSVPLAVPVSSSARWMRFRRRSTPYLLVFPALLVATITVFYPILWAINLSVHKWIFYQPDDRPFLGLQNFQTALADPTFWTSMRHTGIWVLTIVVGQFVFGFLQALLLNEMFVGRGIVRALILIPWVTPTILSAFMWRWMYNINYGVINRTLLNLGWIDAPLGFLSQDSMALPSVIVVVIWSGTPFFALMILAAMQAIPEDLYEAAKVDGANAVQRLRNVTIPLIAPTVAVTVLLRTIWVANGVDLLFVMTGGGPGISSLTVPVYVLLKARAALDMGYSSAMALILGLLLMTIVLIYLAVMEKSEVKMR